MLCTYVYFTEQKDLLNNDIIAMLMLCCRFCCVVVG